MGTVIVHAGMPKTGSTSVQSWLVQHATQLRDRHGVQIVVASDASSNGDVEVRLEPYEGGRINSGPLITAWFGAKQSPQIAQRFVDDLSRFAAKHPTVLVTAEALSEPFWRVDEPFLAAFEQLAQSHPVRVAYYVRPQHTAIEAGWREGGYKLGYEPTEYVDEFSKRLHYLSTLDAVEDRAPHVDFVMRPFRRDLLDGANTVADFVRRFLQLPADIPNRDENPGLPIELVNLLRDAPNGWFWTRGRHEETYPRRELRRIFEELDLDQSSRIRRSRLLLQELAHVVFEPANQKLIARLGWSGDDFVPPPFERLEPVWEISELDQLWAGHASPAERAFFFHALRTALDRRVITAEERR